jgi:hypothetical protein
MSNSDNIESSTSLLKLPLASARLERVHSLDVCYIVFTTSQHGNHSHIIATHDPVFETPEKRFDQIGPLAIGPNIDELNIEQLITQEIERWLGEPANANYLSKSANPVAVFHDKRAVDLPLASWLPQYVVKCILHKTKVFAKTYELDPLAAARWCQ